MLPFDFHSPVEPLHFPLFDEKQVRVDVKRDDLIHPFISGNKWRKLKHILHDAQEAGKNHLVTFGGAWSNHLLATACAGAKFGFSTTAFVRGEEVSNPVLSLCRIFGMELIFVSRSAYRAKETLFETHFGGNQQAYCIPEGGHSTAGAQGCSELLDELHHEYDHIWCACGTGTTLAGLAMGKLQKGLKAALHGVPVLASGDFLNDAIRGLYPSLPPSTVTLHTSYHFGGYAKSTAELLRFVQGFCAHTGILIEPVYTGKLCYALFDRIANDYFRPGDRILLLHTGGITGILGMHEQLAQHQNSTEKLF
ncbi:1-aminocyclopropane-1-carboxylate deaminase/D-cysteine desulfhydrase [Parapedobacter lycopersici]|uniref:1-aminocyclopropane-1-carboxylate deaminase/D-cysteine desulfhydrase n=1 Tax=Parapedobacter lycopersici TaxID=1864939 RepID=UPI00214D741F|nr:pyridoxal-phosphate dependent enzyme [Parapedobacter lycopersici]